jgi:uncharacterized RDD family membrane protein YckC
MPGVSTSANPYAPPRARVRDVAAPKVSQVPAERSTRLGAAMVDGLVFSVMVYGPMILGAVLGAMLAPSADEGGMVALLSLGLAFVGFAIWTWMTLKQMRDTGQSLAKKYFNIKVVNGDGSPASLGKLIWKRNVITWVLSIIPMYGLVEVLFIFAEDRKCLHDKIADTMVVEA